MTYGELKEKYGELVGYTSISGGRQYKLENGYGYYSFYSEKKPPFITHPEYGFSYPEIKDDEVCTGLFRANAMDMFNTSAESLTIEDIAHIEGLEIVGNVKVDPMVKGEFGSWDWCLKLRYSGWNEDMITIIVKHFEENVIDSTSSVNFVINWRYLVDQETDSE